MTSYRASRFQTYKYTAVIVGGILTILGILGFWWAASVENEVTRTLLNNIASMLATVGLLSVIYDAFLKPRLLQDMGAATDLGASGITEFKAAEELQLSTIGPLQRDVLIIVQDLRAWLERGDWAYLASEAASRVLSVRLYCGHMPEMDPEEAVSTVEKKWKMPSSDGQSPYDRGSRIVILSVSGWTQTVVYRSGNAAVVFFTNPYGRFISGAAMGMSVRQSKSDLWDWIQSVEPSVSITATELIRITKDRTKSKWF